MCGSLLASVPSKVLDTCEQLVSCTCGFCTAYSHIESCQLLDDFVDFFGVRMSPTPRVTKHQQGFASELRLAAQLYCVLPPPVSTDRSPAMKLARVLEPSLPWRQLALLPFLPRVLSAIPAIQRMTSVSLRTGAFEPLRQHPTAAVELARRLQLRHWPSLETQQCAHAQALEQLARLQASS